MGDINSNSVESIIKKYGDMIYKIAYSMTKNKCNSEDIFQEVFLKYLRYSNEHNFDNEEHRKRWLIRVCVNCGKDMLSSRWSKTISIDDDISINLEDTSSASNIEDNSAMSLDLKNALDKLPPKYRTVIYLFYFEQLSTHEIAIAINSNSALVRVYLSRDRKILKEILGGEYGFD